MYPPYVKMTFTMTNTTPLKFSVQVTGCLKEANLKRDITFPLGNHTTKVRLFAWMHKVILQTTEVAHSSIPNGISQLQNRSHTVITAGKIWCSITKIHSFFFIKIRWKTKTEGCIEDATAYCCTLEKYWGPIRYRKQPSWNN